MNCMSFSLNRMEEGLQQVSVPQNPPQQQGTFVWGDTERNVIIIYQGTAALITCVAILAIAEGIVQGNDSYFYGGIALGVFSVASFVLARRFKLLKSLNQVDADLAKNNDELETRIDEVESERTKLQSINRDLKAEKDALNALNNKLTIQVTEFDKEKKAMSVEVGKLTSGVNELTRDKEALEGQVKLLTVNIDNIGSEIDRIKQENKALEEQIDAMRMENDELSQTLEAYKKIQVSLSDIVASGQKHQEVEELHDKQQEELLRREEECVRRLEEMDHLKALVSKINKLDSAVVRRAEAELALK